MMEVQKTPDLPNQPSSLPQEKVIKYFTKLQSFLILLAAFVVFMGGGYLISDHFLWAGDDSHLQDNLTNYKKLVKLEPNEPEHRVGLGHTYYLLEDYDEAIKQYMTAISLDENYYSAIFNLGVVYEETGMLDDAIKQAQRAVELAPTDYTSQLLIGTIYRQLGDYESALISLNQASILFPANSDVINEIGRVAEDQGNYEEAEKIFKEALSYDSLYKPAAEGLERIAKKVKDNK